jgi:hypothetical protein
MLLLHAGLAQENSFGSAFYWKDAKALKSKPCADRHHIT